MATREKSGVNVMTSRHPQFQLQLGHRPGRFNRTIRIEPTAPREIAAMIAFKRNFLLFVVFSLLVGFVLLEISVRIFFRSSGDRTENKTQMRPGYFVQIPNTTYVQTNEIGEQVEVRIDENGFRNPSGILPDAEAIVIGDSFIMAINTPEENTLVGTLRHRGFHVYNAGMDGNGTVQQYYILADLLKQCHPRLVILAFYLGNDFRDNYFASFSSSGNEGLHGSEQRPLETPKDIRFISIKHRIRQVLRLSRTCALLDDHLYSGWIKGQAKDYMASFCLSEIVSFRTKEDPRFQTGIEKSRAAIKIMNDTLNSMGIGFYVMGIPSKAQVLKSFREVSSYMLDRRSEEFTRETIDGGYSFDQPNDILAEICGELGISYIPLIGVFRSNYSMKLYYDLDLHWTPAGQDLVSSILNETFTQVLHAKERSRSSSHQSNTANTHAAECEGI